MQLDALWRQLAPTALQFLAALMPIGVFYFFDQGAEVLSMVAEDLTFGRWNDPGSYIHPLLFLGGSFAAATAIWYSARTLISIDIASLPPSAGPIGVLRDWLQEWWPRLLAWISVSMVAACFFLRIGEYGGSANAWFVRWLAIMGLLHLALIWPLWKVMRFRRNWVRARTGAATYQRHTNWNALTTAAPDTIGVSVGFLIGSATLLIAVWAAPIFLGRFIGTGAMLSFAAMTWVSAGSLLIWIRSRTSIPTVFLLVALALICSHVMDNHHIR
ncbi:MAG TPA: hypothetical protein VK961_09930, partial [Chthoniobacter sp.]|nr:hypothetical protein [Chthoniobacter sp.]